MQRGTGETGLMIPCVARKELGTEPEELKQGGLRNRRDDRTLKECWDSLPCEPGRELRQIGEASEEKRLQSLENFFSQSLAARVFGRERFHRASLPLRICSYCLCSDDLVV